MSYTGNCYQLLILPAGLSLGFHCSNQCNNSDTSFPTGMPTSLFFKYFIKWSSEMKKKKRKLIPQPAEQFGILVFSILGQWCAPDWLPMSNLKTHKIALSFVDISPHFLIATCTNAIATEHVETLIYLCTFQCGLQGAYKHQVDAEYRYQVWQSQGLIQYLLLLYAY